jgi:hypothetical protein
MLKKGAKLLGGMLGCLKDFRANILARFGVFVDPIILGLVT